MFSVCPVVKPTMELRQLWKVARRWWWLIVLPPFVVGLYSAVTYQAPGAGYALVMRYTAGQPTALSGDPQFARGYYDWLTSEYIVGALKDWVRTGQFAQAVSDELKARGRDLPAAAVAASISNSDNQRSLLVVYLGAGDADQLRAIAEAVTVVLQTRNADIFPPLAGQPARVTPLDAPAVGPAGPPSLRARLDIPLRLGLALALGAALALAAHYFDPFVRDKAELEKLGARFIVAIPKDGK